MCHYRVIRESKRFYPFKSFDFNTLLDKVVEAYHNIIIIYREDLETCIGVREVNEFKHNIIDNIIYIILFS